MSDVKRLLLQQDIDADIAEMKLDFEPSSSSSTWFFNTKSNDDLLNKAVKKMAELIRNNHEALYELRKLQDSERDAAKNSINYNLDNYVHLSTHNNLLKSYDNLKLSVKETQRMNNEKDRSIKKLRKQCTSMHKENTRLRAEIKALKSQEN